MKTFFGILSLLSLLSFSVACNRDSGMTDSTKDVQREEAIQGDDMRETGSHKRVLPAQEEEAVRKDRDTMNLGPNKSSED